MNVTSKIRLESTIRDAEIHGTTLWFFQGSVLQGTVEEVLGGGGLTRIRNEGKREREVGGVGKGLRDSAASFPPAYQPVASALTC